MKNSTLQCTMATGMVNSAAGNRNTQNPNSEFTRKLKRSILAIFCVGLMMGTTSCCKSIGCGTWGKVKAKPNNKQYACYHKFN